MMIKSSPPVRNRDDDSGPLHRDYMVTVIGLLVTLMPVVLVADMPGVVGTLDTGIVADMLDMEDEVGMVDGMVPALMTPPRLGLRLDVVPMLTVRPVETVVPVVITPTNPPWIALFTASRLLGASVWICKPPLDAVVPEDIA
jgi:hypothetical protein